MQAAAHTPGGVDGVPQSVGKEMIGSDEAQGTGREGRAAGIMFMTADNRLLLTRRGNGGDYPGHWSIPGGHQESGESIEDCARREANEETGLDYKGDLAPVYDDGYFATFLAKNIEEFIPKLCDESTGYDWSTAECLPQPVHPGLNTAIRVAQADTEIAIAKLISEGVLTSPQPYANMWLVALRITGTGLAYRSSLGEFVWRDPVLYMNDEFLQRCNGLTVILDHPDESILDSEEFKKRNIGSICLPYFKNDDEVWGIAKIYDAEAIKIINNEEVSTSPSVVFDDASGNVMLSNEKGDPLLIEGKPFLLDHLAIVTQARGSKGVWDKQGPATGVLINNPEVKNMPIEINEPKADAAGASNADVLSQILTHITGLSTRLDAMEKNLPQEPLTKISDKSRKDEDDEKNEDEDEAKNKADSEGKMEGVAGEQTFKSKRSDEDEEEDKEAERNDMDSGAMADAQAKADSVYQAFGKAASRPLQGENLLAYRKRLLRGLQSYSDQYKDIKLGAIADVKLLDIAERQIFTDAMKAARNDAMVGAGQLVPVIEHDATGRRITKFRGDIGVMLEPFTVPAQRVVQFNVNRRAV